MALPFADINMFQASAGSRNSTSVNPAYITAPISYHPIPLGEQHFLQSDGDVFRSTGVSHGNGFSKSLVLRVESPEKPHMIISSEFSPTLLTPAPSGTRRNGAPRPRIVKRKSSAQDVSLKKAQACSIIPGTPILDAHRGTTQAELEAKARRYKERNPELEEFDDRWLASFSGKLSEHGEMIEHFRCYVVGCTQMNKRRDHMIVHVGSHLDQRQFKCIKW